MESLVEIVMDLGRVPFARYATDEAPLSSQAVTESDLEEAVLRVSYSKSTPCHAAPLEGVALHPVMPATVVMVDDGLQDTKASHFDP